METQSIFSGGIPSQFLISLLFLVFVIIYWVQALMRQRREVRLAKEKNEESKNILRENEARMRQMYMDVMKQRQNFVSEIQKVNEEVGKSLEEVRKINQAEKAQDSAKKESEKSDPKTPTPGDPDDK